MIWSPTHACKRELQPQGGGMQYCHAPGLRAPCSCDWAMTLPAEAACYSGLRRVQEAVVLHGNQRRCKPMHGYAGRLCTWTACIGSTGTLTCLRGAVASRCVSVDLLS